MILACDWRKYMRDINSVEIDSVDGGWLQVVVVVGAAAAWAYANRADLMESYDAAVQQNQNLNSQH